MEPTRYQFHAPRLHRPLASPTLRTTAHQGRYGTDAYRFSSLAILNRNHMKGRIADCLLLGPSCFSPAFSSLHNMSTEHSITPRAMSMYPSRAQRLPWLLLWLSGRPRSILLRLWPTLRSRQCSRGRDQADRPLICQVNDPGTASVLRLQLFHLQCLTADFILLTPPCSHVCCHVVCHDSTHRS